MRNTGPLDLGLLFSWEDEELNFVRTLVTTPEGLNKPTTSVGKSEMGKGGRVEVVLVEGDEWVVNWLVFVHVIHHHRNSWGRITQLGWWGRGSGEADYFFLTPKSHYIISFDLSSRPPW